MNFKTPSLEELKRISNEIGLQLDNKDTQFFLDLMQPFAEGYQRLETLDKINSPKQNTDRTYWPPTATENQYGAWRVKTSIKKTNQGPLHGRTVVIKDNILVKDIPMANGSDFLKDFIPEYDATVVTSLLDAGAEIKGKSVCEYFCLSGGSSTAQSGVVRNPRQPEYSTGGSSSGSAALVVAGEVDLALGTDQGGSVRIPASWTGACGMKATHGVVPYSGGAPMETSIDYIGPITTNVKDNATLLEVISRPDFPPGNKQENTGKYTNTLMNSINEIKIAVLKEGFNQPSSESDVDECVMSSAQHFKDLGASVDEISIPQHTDGIAIWGAIVSDGFWQTLQFNGLGYNYDGIYSQVYHKVMGEFSNNFNEAPVNAKLLLLLGKYLERYNGHYYAMAKNQVRILRAAYDKVFEHYDLILMPTTLQKPSRNPLGSESKSESENIIMAQAFGNTHNTCQFNLTGHPAMSIPCGLRNKLPIGMMLVGKYFDEATIYRAAYQFEQSTPWEER